VAGKPLSEAGMGLLIPVILIPTALFCNKRNSSLKAKIKKKKKHPKKQNKQKTTKNNKAKQKTPKLMHICSFTFLQSVATYYLSELPTFVFEICDKHLFPSQMFSTDHGQILLNHTSSSINNFNNR